MNSNEYIRCKVSESLDLEKSMLWRMQQRRKESFEEMNSDVDEIVDQCLKARRRLETLEDSNRNLQNEKRSLRSKYEALLEKNKNDSNIILRLKDSESVLNQALKKQEETNESLQELQMKTKEKILERKLLQNDRAKLFFKSQTITNNLRKINLKHKRIYDLIEKENRTGKESEIWQTTEMKELRSQLANDDRLLEDWLTNNVKRDEAIHRLQDDMRDGFTVTVDTNEDLQSEEATDTDTASIGTELMQETEKDDISTKIPETEEGKPGITDSEMAFRREWMRKKTLYEAAEKLKEHSMNYYMSLNQRIQELNIELVNVRQWRIDKEAEKNEAVVRVAKMEQLVSQKRRMKPVPTRSSIVELEIWSKMQRKANDMLREVVSRCLLVKIEDADTYLDFAKGIKDMYLDSLLKQHSLENKKEKEAAEKEETSTPENET